MDPIKGLEGAQIELFPKSYKMIFDERFGFAHVIYLYNYYSLKNHYHYYN